MRRWYARRSLEERRASVARRDPEAVRASEARRYEKQKRDPELMRRRRARTALNNALRAGRVERGPCDVCGHDVVEAHHEDYAEPLKVRWLCKIHHDAHHLESATA